MVVEFVQDYERVVKDVRVHRVDLPFLRHVHSVCGAPFSLDRADRYLRRPDVVKAAERLQCLLRPFCKDHVDYFCLHYFSRSGGGNHPRDRSSFGRYKGDEPPAYFRICRAPDGHLSTTSRILLSLATFWMITNLPQKHS